MPVPQPPKNKVTYVQFEKLPSREVPPPPKPKPPKPTKPVKKPKPVCTCTNHLGTKKQEYRTKEAALHEIVTHHMWTQKAYTVYPCPTKPGKFHVASHGKFKKLRDS